jgi:protein-tyrosine kinase
MPTKAPENVLPIEASSRVIARQDRRIGSILAEQGKLGVRDIERVLELQQRQASRFGEAALRVGLITKEDLQSALAAQYDFPHLLPGTGGISTEVVVAYEPLHPRAEELRALRAELLIRWSKAEVRHRVLAIASPGPGEGRSYVAANLAVLFSQLGERTLLIDADLRAPRQHRIFDVADTFGLSAVLSGRADRSAVMPIPNFGRLSVLPAGARPPNPQELLSGHVLGDLLEQWRAEFDVILLDTPPAKLCADARIVAFRAGGVMVLARKNRTRVADTTGVMRELTNTGARIVGTVLNAF